MDNRELNLTIPEMRRVSLAGQDGIDSEEEDESNILETLEYVPYAIAHHWPSSPAHSVVVS